LDVPNRINPLNPPETGKSYSLPVLGKVGEGLFLFLQEVYCFHPNNNQQATINK